MRGAEALFNEGDARVSKYDREEIMKMLRNTACHSPEQSESDPDNEDKRQIVVYDYSWKSTEVYQHFNLYIIYM
jgi:hypothetical protein